MCVGCDATSFASVSGIISFSINCSILAGIGICHMQSRQQPNKQTQPENPDLCKRIHGHDNRNDKFKSKIECYPRRASSPAHGICWFVAMFAFSRNLHFWLLGKTHTQPGPQTGFNNAKYFALFIELVSMTCLNLQTQTKRKIFPLDGWPPSDEWTSQREWCRQFNNTQLVSE